MSALRIAAIALVATCALLTTADAQDSTQDSAQTRPTLERYVHRVAFQPTRLANVDFPELSFAYRRLLGAAPRWVVGGSVAGVLRPTRLRSALDGPFVGFGLGLEGRVHLRKVRVRRFEAYATAGVEVSRAYYRALVGTEPVDGANFSRIVETEAVSRREELNLGIGFEYTSEAGFLLDLRPTLAFNYLSAGVRGGQAGPIPGINGDLGLPGEGFVQDRGEGSGWRLYPRLRIGIGWSW